MVIGCSLLLHDFEYAENTHTGFAFTPRLHAGSRRGCRASRHPHPCASTRRPPHPSARSRSSSTRVASGPSGTNLTSTSELTVVSGFQWLLMSQLTTNRCGGSQTRILPTLACEPSSFSSYQRSPSRVDNRLQRRITNRRLARPPASEPGCEDLEGMRLARLDADTLAYRRYANGARHALGSFSCFGVRSTSD